MNRIQLDPIEWDFSSVSKRDSADAWRWEIFRELERARPGFGLERIEKNLARLITKKRLLNKPFLSLDEAVRAKLFVPLPESPAFREVSFQRAPQTSDEIAGEELMFKLTGCGTHVVQIAWHEPKTTIIHHFRKWIEANLEAKRNNSGLSKHFRKARSKLNPKTFLKDLACYRFSEAGYTSTEAAKFLLWISRTRTTGFSRTHFSDARGRTKRRLQWLADLLRLGIKASADGKGREDCFNPFNVPVYQFR